MRIITSKNRENIFQYFSWRAVFERFHLEHLLISIHIFSILPCMKHQKARVYLLSAGFSLTFGSMFAKTYRVHRIFTHNWGGICKVIIIIVIMIICLFLFSSFFEICKDKMLKDTKLISMVCCLLLFDGLVVTFWTLTDPMERHLKNLTLEISLTDRSVVYQPQVNLTKIII